MLLGIVCMTSLLIAGCGGGGGSSSQQAAGKKAVISYSVSNPGSDPVSALQFRYVLPAGATVSTVSGSTQIDPANLVAGTAQSGVQLFGSYSSPSVVRLTVSTADSTAIQNGFGSDVLFRLTCDLPQASTLAAQDFIAQPVSNIIAFWYDVISRNSLPVTGVAVTVTATVTK